MYIATYILDEVIHPQIRLVAGYAVIFGQDGVFWKPCINEA